MALKIDEIMDLSLDDYIAISKKSTNNAIANVNKDEVSPNSGGKNAKFGRRKGNIDDDDEDDDDFLMLTAKDELEDMPCEEVTADVWKGPDSSTSYLDCHDYRNDLREKLNNCNQKKSQSISNVQYRMMAPNTAANRPRGIPTLLPLDVEVNNRNGLHNGYKRKRGNRRNRSNNYQRGLNNSGNVYNNTNAGNGGGVSNGRVQKNRNQETESKFPRFSVARDNSCNNRLNNNMNMPQRARNMIIETPSSSVNLLASPALNPSFKIPHSEVPERRYNNTCQSLPIGNLTPQAEAVLNLNSMGAQNNSLSAGNNNESLKSLLGFKGNVSDEMLPIFASRLMQYIQSGLQNPVVHKPVYDMKIQKDIHEIQRKPLLYKCPGGEVVSSDGTGVDCKIIPRTSGVSLNCRFA